MQECDYNHLLLYAKGHYEHSSDKINDVKTILGHRCGFTEPSYMSDRDMWQVLVNCLLMYADKPRLREFLDDIFKPDYHENNCYVFFSPECPLVRAVNNVLWVLQQLEVFDDKGQIILNIGKADKNILPLSKNLKRKMKEEAENGSDVV